MKTILFTVVFLILCKPGSAQTPAPKHLNVAIFVYPGVGLGDLNGPLDVFVKASSMTQGQYRVYTVALRPAGAASQQGATDAGTITTQGGGIRLKPDYVVGEMPAPDILVIPGGSIGLLDSMTRDKEVISFIQQYQHKVRVLMSVCTGAYLLGKSGALNGHKATTHFFVADDLKEQFPGLTMVKDVRFVDEDSLLTTSGVTTGMDGALHLVTRYSGERVAGMVAGALQYSALEKEKWPQPVEGMKFDRERRKKMGLLAQ